MIRKVYQNGFADGNVVPIGTTIASGWVKSPDITKQRTIAMHPIMTLGVFELNKVSKEQLKLKKKRNVDAFTSFINKNF